jgi:hypothetical protein
MWPCPGHPPTLPSTRYIKATSKRLLEPEGGKKGTIKAIGEHGVPIVVVHLTNQPDDRILVGKRPVLRVFDQPPAAE